MKETLAKINKLKDVKCNLILKRNIFGFKSCFKLISYLRYSNYIVNLMLINYLVKNELDLKLLSFNYMNFFWSESRLSKNFKI